MLYDENALRLAFNGQSRPRLLKNPQLIADPKLALRDIVWQVFRKEYLNIIHNERIAKNMNLEELQRSSSFRPFPPFMEQVKRQLK